LDGQIANLPAGQIKCELRSGHIDAANVISKVLAVLERVLLDFAPVVSISAKTGQRVARVLELAVDVWGERRKRIGTGELNRLLAEATARYSVGDKTARLTIVGDVLESTTLDLHRTDAHFDHDNGLAEGQVGGPNMARTDPLAAVADAAAHEFALD
jgi:hypothetical protein